jgi:low affinity Fe/Cu permease
MAAKNNSIHPPLPRMDPFSSFAQRAARIAGKPGGFLAACAVILVWLATGPFFGFNDTWQLVINTSTTIVTFLMVFLIQNTQNRDALALQVKLAELIIQMPRTVDLVADAEDMSERQLDRLHEQYKALAREKAAKRAKSRRN